MPYDLSDWEFTHREYLQTTYRWLQEWVFQDDRIKCYEAYVRFAYEYSEHPGFDGWNLSPRVPAPMGPLRLRALAPWKPEWRILSRSQAAATSSDGGADVAVSG